MLSAAASLGIHGPVGPTRYRSLQVLMLLMVVGSLLASVWLLPSRLEQISAATERGETAKTEHLLDGASQIENNPGDVRALANMALATGKPDLAASILEQSIKPEAASVPALRLLREVQRQRHDMRAVAMLNERIYARTGDVDALREAADLYASQRRTPERISALQRIAAINRATAEDVAELAQRLTATGASSEALRLVMTWIDDHAGRPQSTLITLAAALSAATADAIPVAAHLGGLIGRSGSDDSLEALVQAYTERGKAELSLAAARALGNNMLKRPEVAVLVAQLETLQGNMPAARDRLLALEREGHLPAEGTSLLVELNLQFGDLPAAIALLAMVPSDQRPNGLHHQLIDAAFSAGRLDLLRNWPATLHAGMQPADASVIALAQGRSQAAERLARAALRPRANLSDFGRAFVSVIRKFGLERLASDRLVEASQSGAFLNDHLEFAIALSENQKTDVSSLLKTLRGLRDTDARIGGTWATIAAARGQDTVEVAAWVSAHGRQLTGEILAALLQLSWDRSNRNLASAVAGGLLEQEAPPQNWKRAEIEWTVRAIGEPSTTNVKAGLAIVGSPTTPEQARNRITLKLLTMIKHTPFSLPVGMSTEMQPALTWLADQGESQPSQSVARLDLLTSIAPEQALERLARSSMTNEPRLLALYVTALLRTGRLTDAERALTIGLASSSDTLQNALLFDVMGRVSQTEALSVLRVAARTGRKDWVAALEDGLVRAGLRDELVANLRARALTSRTDAVERQAVISRLVELNDRAGAIDILSRVAAKLPPGNPTVEQLVYLWGPRASPEAVAWLRERATTSSASTQAAWLDHLAYVGAPQAVIEILDQQPALLATSALAVRGLGSALLTTHSPLKSDLDAVVRTATSPDVLLALARLAIDNSQHSAAWHAASKAMSYVPNDTAVLTIAAQSASLVRRSDDAATLFAKLLQTGPQPPDVSVDAADALLTAHRVDFAQRVLSDVLARLPHAPSNIADARLRARALSLSSRPAAATELLQLWLSRFPSHSGLRADMLALKLARPAY